MKSLCKILEEDNKKFSRSSSEINLTVGTLFNPTQEIQVHTSIINAVLSVVNNLESSWLPNKQAICSALETSVF